jgi:deoxyribodipyrimidine photo-lyase
MHHLLDADPAANTLSWRWAAGIHTLGKHYLARASNISQYTNNQYNPIGQLNESATPLPIDKIYEINPLVLPPITATTGRVGHLMFPEDLAAPPEICGEIHATAAYLPEAHQTSPLVTEFLNGAIDNTLSSRNGTRFGADFANSLNHWISSERLNTVVISQPTVGLTKDFLASQELPQLTQYFVRRWDRQLWPHATSGFFKFKNALPKLYASLAASCETDLFPDI